MLVGIDFAYNGGELFGASDSVTKKQFLHTKRSDPKKMSFYSGGVTAQQQKNNLVFYGIAPDPLEVRRTEQFLQGCDPLYPVIHTLDIQTNNKKNIVSKHIKCESFHVHNLCTTTNKNYNVLRKSEKNFFHMRWWVTVNAYLSTVYKWS